MSIYCIQVTTSEVGSYIRDYSIFIFPQSVPTSIAWMEIYTTKHGAVLFSVTGVRAKKEAINQEDSVTEEVNCWGALEWHFRAEEQANPRILVEQSTAQSCEYASHAN